MDQVDPGSEWGSITILSIPCKLKYISELGIKEKLADRPTFLIGNPNVCISGTFRKKFDLNEPAKWIRVNVDEGLGIRRTVNTHTPDHDLQDCRGRAPVRMT